MGEFTHDLTIFGIIVLYGTTKYFSKLKSRSQVMIVNNKGEARMDGVG